MIYKIPNNSDIIKVPNKKVVYYNEYDHTEILIITPDSFSPSVEAVGDILKILLNNTIELLGIKLLPSLTSLFISSLLECIPKDYVYIIIIIVVMK